MNQSDLEHFAKDEGIMLAIDDLLVVQEHFRDKLKREPSIAELKVLMTYWSDHCRHTTFNTKLENISITGDEIVKTDMESTLKALVDARKKLGKT